MYLIGKLILVAINDLFTQGKIRTILKLPHTFKLMNKFALVKGA